VTVASKDGNGLACKARDETQKWLFVIGNVVREKAMPVKVALKTVFEGQKYNI
jgi:hypothetical protein